VSPARRGDDPQASVAVHPRHPPAVAVGDTEVVVVVAGDDQVSPPDPLPGAGCDDVRVIDLPECDEAVADRGGEHGDMLSGVHHDGGIDTGAELSRDGVSERSGPLRLAAV
jgi:hypothetical protein